MTINLNDFKPPFEIIDEEKISSFEREENLPNLKGSEKQIKWGRILRYKFLGGHLKDKYNHEKSITFKILNQTLEALSKTDQNDKNYNSMIFVKNYIEKWRQENEAGVFINFLKFNTFKLDKDFLANLLISNPEIQKGKE